MSPLLRCIVGLVVLTYFFVLIHFLKRRLIDLKYSLLWLVFGVLMALFTIWPGILYTLVKALGILTPVNGLFLVGIGFSIMILMSMTSIVSKQSDRIRLLVQNQALLEKRIRELEKEKEVQE